MVGIRGGWAVSDEGGPQINREDRGDVTVSVTGDVTVVGVFVGAEWGYSNRQVAFK